jgi:hypothetical protein
MTDHLVDNLAVSRTPEEIRARLEDTRAERIELMVSQVVVHDGPSELAALYEILAYHSADPTQSGFNPDSIKSQRQMVQI